MAFWFVYVIQCEDRPGGKPGFFYVGCTTDYRRRLKQHNGLLKGGAKYTSKFKNWHPKALYGPYNCRSEAMKAEYALKHGKRGISRCRWTIEDSGWCRGLGPNDPWVLEGASQ